MTNHPTIKQVFTDPIHFLAFGFGSGLSPKAPGTVGTLAAIPVYLYISQPGLLVYSIILVAIILLAIYVSGESSKKLHVHDHEGIVIDEICGYLLTMVFAPRTWIWIVAGFILFRVFDIFKPWPIRTLDLKVSGGFGIVIDDLMAGVYALLSLQFLVWLSTITKSSL